MKEIEKTNCSEEIKYYLEELYPEIHSDILLAEGFDSAFIGVAESYTSAPKACYDKEKCIKILQDRDGMSLEEAHEFFDFNVSSAYVGEFTPSFISPLKKNGSVLN